jgi:hypothetical protein
MRGGVSRLKFERCLQELPGLLGLALLQVEEGQVVCRLRATTVFLQQPLELKRGVVRVLLRQVGQSQVVACEKIYRIALEEYRRACS